MEYKNILKIEIEATTVLYSSLVDVAMNLKIKKISETLTTLKSLKNKVDQYNEDLNKVKKFHRDPDSDEFNVFKILKNLKSKINMFESLAKNKFRKIVETDLDEIVDEISVTRVHKLQIMDAIYEE